MVQNASWRGDRRKGKRGGISPKFWLVTVIGVVPRLARRECERDNAKEPNSSSSTTGYKKERRREEGEEEEEEEKGERWALPTLMLLLPRTQEEAKARTRRKPIFFSRSNTRYQTRPARHQRPTTNDQPEPVLRSHPSTPAQPGLHLGTAVSRPLLGRIM